MKVHDATTRRAFSARRPLLAVVAVFVTACGSAASPVASGTANTPSASVALPHSAVGDQLVWFLGAAAHPPITDSMARAHFDAGFLAHVNVATLNAPLPSLGTLRPTSITSEEPDALVLIVTTTAGDRLQVDISVDGSGLISGLRLMPISSALPRDWAGVDAAARSVAPEVHLLAAEVTNGSCRVIHSLDPATPVPLGSAFKLYVLGAVGRAVAARRLSWDQPLTVTSAVKSLPSGELQTYPDGTRVPLRDVASKAISISDNTAADMLIGAVGRPALEAELSADGMADPSRDEPFLTTREMFILKLDRWPSLGTQYAGANQASRRALLAGSVDPAPLPSGAEAWTAPRDVDHLEWFASALDLCHLYANLLAMSHTPADAEVGSVLGINDGGLGLDGAKWKTTWFKGGSEPGVLALSYLATTQDGRSYVTVVLTEKPNAPIAELTATASLLTAIKGAFALVSS